MESAVMRLAEKEIRSRDRAYAQRVGDWFTVHAVRDIIGAGKTALQANELGEEKKKFGNQCREKPNELEEV